MSKAIDCRLHMSSTLGQVLLNAECVSRAWAWQWGWGHYHGASSRQTWTQRYARPLHHDGTR